MTRPAIRFLLSHTAGGGWVIGRDDETLDELKLSLEARYGETLNIVELQREFDENNETR